MIKDYQQKNVFFSDKELKCKGSGDIKLDPRFESALRTLRHLFGKSMILTSCCRTPEHNKTIGGHPKSLHLTENPFHHTLGCMACDVSRHNLSEQEQQELEDLAYSLGWSVGQAKTFIHLDRRVDIGLKQRKFGY